jgi:hypothetical protein
MYLSVVHKCFDCEKFVEMYIQVIPEKIASKQVITHEKMERSTMHVSFVCTFCQFHW